MNIWTIKGTLISFSWAVKDNKSQCMASAKQKPTFWNSLLFWIKYVAGMLSNITFTFLFQPLISVAIKSSSFILWTHHSPIFFFWKNFIVIIGLLFKVNRINGGINLLSSNNAVLFVYMKCVCDHITHGILEATQALAIFQIQCPT